MALCLVLCMFGAVACQPHQPATYKITVAETTNGTITADKQTAAEGETVTLTVTPDADYILKSGSLKFNDTAITGTTFKMPAEDVTVTAEFVKDMSNVGIETITKDGKKLTATQLSKTATAYIFTQFGETALTVTAYVQDATLKDNDGFGVLFASEQEMFNGLIPDGKTVAVTVTADGNVTKQTTDSEGQLTDLQEGATGTYKLWSEDGENVAGYKVVITVDYTQLGLTKENAKDKITFCPVLYNANSSIAPSKAYFNDSVDETKANTFVVITDDNSYRDNTYSMPSYQLGGYGNIAQGEYWDVSQDYYPSNPEYANRKVVLSGHDNADNNLVFYRTNAEVMYAEATFKLTSITNPAERWGKFGMMLFDGASTTGLMYYVDALIGEGPEIKLENISGTDLGIGNSPKGQWNSWVPVANNKFDLETKTITLGMVYQNGYVYLYANGEKVHSLYYGAYNEDMRFGFKSFGLGLEVTNYFSSTDPEADGWSDKVEVITQQTVDTLFIGDSYMDFWKNSGQSGHVAQLPSYANEGIGGTKTTDWLTKVGDMGVRYLAENIVMHIGVNDIDDEGLTAEKTMERLTALFNAYHEQFPEAQLYWVSLVPNTMFLDKCPVYVEVNNAVKQWAENNTFVTYIDVATAFTAEDGSARTNMFYDGLHFNREYGYPLWAKLIMKALGYTHAQGTELGDATNYAYSDGWTFIEDGNKAYNTGSGEQAVWMQNATGTDIYAEFSATIGQVYGNDPYPKFGAILRNDDVSIFGYVDAAGLATGAGGKGTNIVYRPNVTEGNGVTHAGDWQWIGGQAGGSAMIGEYTNGTYVKIAIAKLGNTIALWVNDTLTSRTNASYIDATDKVSVGFIGFNLEMTVEGLYVTTDVEEITEKVEGPKAQDAVIDGKADDAIYTAEVLGNVNQFAFHADGKTHFELAAVKGTDGVYFIATIYAPENTRNGSAWYEYANIELRFGNDDGTQQYVYFSAPGFASVATSTGITQAASDGGVLMEDGEYADLYKVVVEFFAPFSSFAGYDAASEEIAVKAWGWVYGDTGWTNAMNVGKYPAYTVSEHGLRFERTISVLGNNAALTVTPSSDTARKGDVVTLNVVVADGQELESIKVNGELIQAVEGVYSFVMPDENVTVEASLKGISVSSQVQMPAGTEDATITADKATATIGETVTFTVHHTAEVVLTSVTVNGTPVEAVEGIYSYTVQEGDTGVAIVAKFDYAPEMTIDGVLAPEENYGTPVGFWVEDNRKVTVYAVKGQYGIYFFVEAYTNTLINDNDTQWFMNHNFEFYIDNGAQCYVNSRNESAGVTKSMWTSALQDSGDFNGKYRYTAEIFVHKSLIAQFDEEIQLNYAFKAPNETARWEGMSNNRWNRGDWWNSYIGGSDGNIVGAYGQGNGRPANLFITEEGLVSKLPVAQNATIDGVLTEYAEKTSITVGNENAKFTVSGYTAADGLYLAFTIKQKQLAAPTAEWHLNDNLEVKIDNRYDPETQGILFASRSAGFSLFDKFIIAMGPVTDYAMVRTEIDADGYKYQTVVELFIAMDNPTTATNIQFGCNGNGFGGWQSLVWDNNYAYVTADGVAFANELATADGVTLDGVADEAFAGLQSVSGEWKGDAVTLTGKKLAKGIVLYATINHVKPVGDKLQADGENPGEEWWRYLNVEFRMGNNRNTQICASVKNNYTQYCAMGVATTGEGPYTTTFEMYVPYGSIHGTDISGDVNIVMAVVTVDSWGLVFGTWESTTYRVNDTGVVNVG